MRERGCGVRGERRKGGGFCLSTLCRDGWRVDLIEEMVDAERDRVDDVMDIVELIGGLKSCVTRKAAIVSLQPTLYLHTK